MLQKQLSKTGNTTACPIAVIIKNEKILIGHRHYTPDKWKTISVWTCPGGRCNAGESLETTLRREVEEETGIKELEILDYIGEVPGAKEGDMVSLFLCKTNQDAQLMEPDKFSEWRWVDLQEYANDFPGYFINNDVRKMIAEFLTHN
jgi:ADP-ribose pyrophosphatase YjhB (NUDIX family)